MLTREWRRSNIIINLLSDPDFFRVFRLAVGVSSLRYKVNPMILHEFEELLRIFETLPKNIADRTYLEICKYPKRRFEEICSRLLCFYLAPRNEHGLGDLFLSSLLEILSPQKKLSFKEETVKVISEENAEGKRLDMLIHSDGFVIGIENKITAGIYNPLEAYKNRINLYGRNNVFKVVLSLRKITDKNELIILSTNEFIRITYSELFETIKKNIGKYLNRANSKYLTFLTDFIQTLENMDGQNIINEKLADFFYDNSNKIKELLDLYQTYDQRTRELQIQRIAELKDKIVELTNDPLWWTWEGWDLVHDKFNLALPKIGIESYYE